MSFAFININTNHAVNCFDVNVNMYEKVVIKTPQKGMTKVE